MNLCVEELGVFEGLSEKLASVFRGLRGKGSLSEGDVKVAMREVRLALLEADVNFKVVKEFTTAVTERAVGEGVLTGLNPGQQVIKIVNEELTALMGSSNSRLTFSSLPPSVYMVVGLQGSGKTTACGKLAGQLRKQGKRPLLVACDVYRPAAVKQLQVLGKGYDIPVFEKGTDVLPEVIAKEALEQAKRLNHDVVIVDTAGRLHVDDALMAELERVKAAVRPTEILLVIDALTGQDAVNAASAFNERVGVDGVILTKLDSDTRGGAALSVCRVTGKPIKFVGTGEKLGDLEPFYPDRMAGRILGMGDVLSLIDKVQAGVDEAEAAKLEQKLKKAEFDLEDFLGQLQQMKKMGPLKGILNMIPGMSNLKIDDADIDERQMYRVEAIIRSMTPKERRNPDILNASRKRRVAAGSGTTIQEVNRLLKQFEDMRKMMKSLMGGGGMFGGKGRKGALPFLK